MNVARKFVPIDFDSTVSDTSEVIIKTRAFLGEPKKKAKRGIPSAQWDKSIDNAIAMMRSGDWNGAIPRDFVAAYAVLHERVYGVYPVELSPGERLYAAGAASRLLAKEFAGDKTMMATWMQWCWEREKSREAWRRENERAGGRIGWRLMFNGTLLTDWRIERSRSARKSRASV